MHHSALTAAAIAHGGEDEVPEVGSLHRYEARVSAMSPVIPRLINQDTASLRRSSSSKASILPPLTHPRQLPVNENNPPTPPQLPGPTFIEHWPSSAGAEPGVNPHRDSSIAKYSHFNQECFIDVVDYDSDDALFERFGNADFINMMNDGYAKVSRGEPDPHPKVIRWINIAGINWDVLSSMALRYHIHSLALEDVLHEQGDIQSKADYYPDHLFIRVLCHIVEEHEEHAEYEHQFHYGRRQEPGFAPPAYGSTTLDEATRYGSPNADLESGDIDRRPQMGSKRKPGTNRSNKPLLHAPDFRTRFTGLNGLRNRNSQEQAALQALTSKDRVNVRREPMYMFLFHDGTIISILPTRTLDFTAPITERLGHRQSVLRTSEDASLLIEALLDLVVDRILEVVAEYQKKIQKLEHDIILNPNMSRVRSLHVISGDLTMHNMTLEPIKTLIYNLRRYDVDRCIAMAKHFKAQAQAEANDGSDLDANIAGSGVNNLKGGERGRGSSSVTSIYGEQQPDTDGDGSSADVPPAIDTRGRAKKRGKRRQAKRAEVKRRDSEREERLRWEEAQLYTPEGIVKGYLSYTCKVYLSDVGDHMNFALTSLDMFAGISQNLIDYAFNMASYEMNKVMNRLTLVTIIFLPLTLLTGYFGMNFSPFYTLDGKSELLFWKIAVPSVVVLITVFMFYDLKTFVEHITRQWKARMALVGLR